MENSRIIKIAELVHGGRSFTGSSSIYSSAGRPTSHSSSESESRNPQSPTGIGGSDTNPKVLTPVNLPSVIVGIIALPTETLDCPNGYCLRFSDDSSTICCDMLGLDLDAIGKKICVLAWNFIPMERGGGFLEIIKWKLLDSGKSLGRCSPLDSYPLVAGSLPEENGHYKSGCRVHGVIESISPVCIVPCSTARSYMEVDFSGAVKLSGFLVRFMACECRICSSKEITKLVDHDHSFAKPVFIYFCGSAAACWHPVMTKLIGSIVGLSGVKKKLVYFSKDDSQLVFVTTENSVLHFPRFSKKWLKSSATSFERRSKCGSYIGMVKGVYMGGILVELDEDIWLLLTDQIHKWPHSVRAGALISIRNVHFVNPKFSWGKMLILGACLKTSVTVECFSPLETSCLVDSYLQRSLREFIESLSFPARFWVLLVISCFQKFAGILPEEEILGSCHVLKKDVLTKMYAKSRIPASMFQPRHGLFTEFCMHESCECNNEPQDCNLKLVVPVSSFVHHYRVILNEFLLGFEKDGNKFGASKCSINPSLSHKPYDWSATEILLSEDIGVTLVGSLKISSSSGRLQLDDGTGNIDVMVMDLPTNAKSSSIYEVTDYSLNVEGAPEFLHRVRFPRKPFSCRSIINCDPLTTENTLPMFISLRNTRSCRNFLLYPCLDWKQYLKGFEGGRFHLLRVTHKFPILQNVDALMLKSSSVFVEAVIFPWDLICTAIEGSMTSARIHEKRIFHEKRSSKRCKTGDTSWRELISSVPDFLPEIPCQVTFRLASNHNLVTSGILHPARGNKSGNASNQQIVKVLLEFTSGWEKYNWLQIGGCYLMKHDSKDSFCFGRSGIFNNEKIQFRPEAGFWSLDFSFDEVLTLNQSTEDCPLAYEGLPEEQRKLSISQPCSDVLIQLPYDVKRLFSVYLKDLEEEFIKPVEEISNVSSCTWGVMTTGLPFQSSFSSSLFPEGNLASFRGDVVAIDMVEPNSYCIRVFVNGQTVNIFGSVSRHAYLTGFGPGVNATFYRVLAIRKEDAFLLSPASFIKINSIKAINDPYMEPSLPSASCVADITSQENVSGASIFYLVSGCKDKQLVNLACKVLTVHLVVLQKSLDNLSENLPSPNIDIPLAGFVVDDGSSTYLCWAKGKSAWTFLRLQEDLPQRTIDDETWIRKGSSWTTIVYHLERIVQKHKRIVVKNLGSQVDTQFQDSTICVGSHHLLTDSEDKFLRFLILNAASGPIWNVRASSMDIESTRRLEREERVEMRTTRLPLANLWGTQVCRVDALARARNLLQDVLKEG